MAANAHYLRDLLASKNIFHGPETLPKQIDLAELARFVDLESENSGWRASKTFKNSYKNIKTTTFSQTVGGDHWCMRHTVLDHVTQVTFRDQFVSNLNGSQYDAAKGAYFMAPERLSFRCVVEKDYIHALDDVVCLESVVAEPGRSGFVRLRNTYKLDPSWLLKRRSFSQWVFVSTPLISGGGRYEESVVLSLRAEPQETELPIGFYISVESLKYDTETETLTWNMATTSDAGGFLPKWMQKLGIDSAVADDVGSFLGFIGF